MAGLAFGQDRSQSDGIQFYQNQDYPQAQRFLKSWTEDHPADSEASYFLGLSQIRLKNPLEEIQSLTRALELNPALTQAYLTLDTAYYQLEHYATALETLKKRPRQNPKTARWPCSGG